MATRQLEIERKYDVDDSIAVPAFGISDGVSGMSEPETIELAAVYFDTSGGDLAAQRITLRRRTGGSDEGWHLKLPPQKEQGARTEVHSPIVGDDQTVPQELLDEVREFVHDRELTPVARIATSRVIRTLQDAAGTPLLELADDHVSATDIRRATDRAWREWEAELLGVDETTFDSRMTTLANVERALLSVGATPSESRSKLARALGRDSLG